MNIIASVLNGPRNPLAGSRTPVLAAVTLVTAALLLAACSSSDNDPGFPTPPVEEPNDFLFDVYGTDANNVYACGDRGAMFRFNGTDWEAVDMGTSQGITTIWSPLGENTLYAVGHGGSIWRNTGGGWSGMTSGTTKDLYGIGQYEGQIHAVGYEGTILRLNGSAWGGLPTSMWILDKDGNPTDTLSTNEDLASLVTVNEFFLGGAYENPNYTGERIGRFGTKPMVLNLAEADDFPAPEPPDPAWTVLPDWLLRPITGSEVSPYEWVYCMTSDPDPARLSRNLMGTSEGWLFVLTEDQGEKVWAKYSPSVTKDPDRGIRDIWLDGPGNVYMVTDAGTVVFQTFDYNFRNATGSRTTLYDGPVALHGIWGTAPDNLFIVGNMDETLLRASHDQVSGEFVITKVDTLTFPAPKSGENRPAVDRFGGPVR